MDVKAGLLTRQAARDHVANLCFVKKRDSTNKRVPRGMVSRNVNHMNRETKGLGLTSMAQFRRKIDRLWSKYSVSRDNSDSDTEPETYLEEDSVADHSTSSTPTAQP